jgi:sec-independent protein translocase protein TatA
MAMLPRASATNDATVAWSDRRNSGRRWSTSPEDNRGRRTGLAMEFAPKRGLIWNYYSVGRGRRGLTPFDAGNASCRIELELAVGRTKSGSADRLDVVEVTMLAWVPGIPELLLFLVIVLLLFGSRLPSLARSLGQSVVEFKKGIKGIEDKSDERPSKSEH